MARTIFITGASSGIGLAAAKLFYAEGWNVVATMRSLDQDTELRLLDERRMLIIRLDLHDYNTIQPAISAAIARFSKIDILLNSAGFSQNGLFETISHRSHNVNAQFGVNLFGVMDMIRAIIPHFRTNKGGGIINVSAGVGALLSFYSAAKLALEGFTEAVSAELASQNIFIKTVIPDGNMTPPVMQRLPKSLYDNDFCKVEDGLEGIHPATVVAEIIYEAATDGKFKLRYIAGNDRKDISRALHEPKYIVHIPPSFN